MFKSTKLILELFDKIRALCEKVSSLEMSLLSLNQTRDEHLEIHEIESNELGGRFKKLNAKLDILVGTEALHSARTEKLEDRLGVFEISVASRLKEVDLDFHKTVSSNERLKDALENLEENLSSMVRFQDQLVERINKLENSQVASYELAYDRFQKMIAFESEQKLHKENPSIINLR